MTKFPTSMVDKLRPVDSADSEPLRDAVDMLSAEGLIVVEGVTPYFAGSVAMMATQNHIRKFCPEDQQEAHFATESSIGRWLGQGRAMFLLLEPIDDTDERRLAGYGWAGPETTEFVKDAKTGFAVRLGERHLTSGFSAPFAQIILETSRQRFGARNFWATTWETNTVARKAYQAVGFEKVDETDIIIDRKAPGRRVEPDRRWYMALPEE
jgi:hypothetical protein